MLSTKAHAKILDIDPSDALSMSGVKLFLTHEDVPGLNMHGILVQDEEVFATDKVNNSIENMLV